MSVPFDLHINPETPPEILWLQLDVAVSLLYDTLGSMAELLQELARPDDTETRADYLDDLERRLPLDELHGYVLAARHELHGGLTAITKARGRLAIRRPTDGDPSTPGSDDPSG